jgi:ankyrin repeat protein
LIFCLSEGFYSHETIGGLDLVEVISILLEYGANVNAVDCSGLTALHHAALHGIVTIIQKLISRGASVRGSKSCWGGPIVFAAEKGHVAAIEILVSNGAYFNAREQDKDWKEGDPWGEWTDGNRALHSAARNGHLDAFRKLLDLGASTGSKDRQGMGVLLTAAGHGSFGIVSLLLSIGVRISEVDRKGNTALHLAIEHNHNQEIKILYHPSIINARNGDGLTALHLACRHYYSRRDIKMLLDCGANIEAKNDKGQTPLIFTSADEGEIEEGLECKVRTPGPTKFMII